MQRNQIIKILIVVLVVFNIIQWWPDDGEESHEEDWQAVQVAQLKINGVNTNNIRYENTRNLFYVADMAPNIKPEITIPPIKEHSVHALSGIKLIGVVYKNKHYEAFLIKGEERYKVRLNNHVTRRYKVKHINIKSIKLKDMQTGKMHIIHLSDE